MPIPPGCGLTTAKPASAPLPPSLSQVRRFSPSVLGNGRDFSEDLTLTLTLVEAQRGGQAGCRASALCPVAGSSWPDTWLVRSVLQTPQSSELQEPGPLSWAGGTN